MQTGKEIPGSELRELYVQLGSRRDFERLEAIRQIRALSADTMLQLMDMNSEHYQQRCRWERIGLYLLLTLCWAAVSLFAGIGAFQNWSPVWKMMFLTALIFLPLP